jgi:hypothetical protein
MIITEEEITLLVMLLEGIQDLATTAMTFQQREDICYWLASDTQLNTLRLKLEAGQSQ